MEVIQIKTFKDLLLEVTWSNTLRSLKNLYYNNIEDKDFELVYKDVFEMLYNMEPITEEMIIDIRFIKLNNEKYYDVSGLKNNQHYALDFTPWAKWLGMKINKNLFNKLTNEDIIAHCLWELTWHGFDEDDIIAKKNELLKRVEEVKDKKSGSI